MFSLMLLVFMFTMVGCLDDTKKETPTPQSEVITFSAVTSDGTPVDVCFEVLTDNGWVYQNYYNQPSGFSVSVTVAPGESASFCMAAYRLVIDTTKTVTVYCSNGGSYTNNAGESATSLFETITN